MKIKLDENMPTRLAGVLRAMGHDVDSVQEEGFAGEDDSLVWAAAQASGRFLVTQDLGFSDKRAFPPGPHRGLMVVRLRAPGAQLLADTVERAFRSADPATWTGCTVVLTAEKLRLLRSERK